jgi:hypothetical protein
VTLPTFAGTTNACGSPSDPSLPLYANVQRTVEAVFTQLPGNFGPPGPVGGTQPASANAITAPANAKGRYVMASFLRQRVHGSE